MTSCESMVREGCPQMQMENNTKQNFDGNKRKKTATLKTRLKCGMSGTIRRKTETMRQRDVENKLIQQPRPLVTCLIYVSQATKAL